MAYCIGLKNFLSALDYHTLANGAEVSKLIGQSETVEVNT